MSQSELTDVPGMARWSPADQGFWDAAIAKNFPALAELPLEQQVASVREMQRPPPIWLGR